MLGSLESVQSFDGGKDTKGLSKATLAGELAALEEIVGMLISKQPQPLLKPIVVKALAWLCDRAHQQACSQVLHSSP